MKCLQSIGLLFLIFLMARQAPCQAWTLSNGLLQRTVRYSPTAGLTTTALVDLSTHAVFVAASQPFASEFSLECDGTPLRGASSDFTFVNETSGTFSGGKELRVTLRSVAQPLEITVVYRVYDGQSGMRKWLVLHNSGSKPVHISHLVIESLAPSVGPSSETTLDTQFGAVPREIFYTGRVEDAGLFIENGRTGDGFAVLNEVPGYMKRTEINGFSHPGHVLIDAMYNTDLMPFERTLAPGETWKTAAVSLLFFKNGDGFFDPHWVLPAYGADVLERRLGPRGAPWIYNTWIPFRRTINQSIVHQLVDIASNIGIDIFTIDDGWEKEYGENTVNRDAFPDGLDPIRRAVEAKGMRLGLWMPLAVVGKDTAAYKQHPEWAAMGRDGRPKMTGPAGQDVVMCLAGPYRDAAAKRINDAIDQYHLAYVKLDLTTVLSAYGGSPGCWPTSSQTQTWSESLGRIYENIRYVTGKVYAKHPDVLIDLSFELWGKQHLVDAGLLDAGDLTWLSNVNDDQFDAAGPRQARTLLYQRALSMPADAMLIGNMRVGIPSPPIVFATEIASAPLLLGDLRHLSPAQQDWYRIHIAWFKQLRKTVNISSSFFPLGHWRQPSALAWDGYARLSRDGSGVITIFTNDSGSKAIHAALPFMPQGSYHIRSVMTGRDLGTISSAALRSGIDVTFSSQQTVEILEIRNAASQSTSSSGLEAANSARSRKRAN